MLGFTKAPAIVKTDRSHPEAQRQHGLGRALFRVMMGSSANLLLAQQTPAPVVEVKQEVKRVDEKGDKHINHYLMKEVIGRGAVGKVRRCIDEDTGAVMAAKIIRKSRLAKKRVGRFGNALQEVRREIAVWKKLSHPHIVALKEVIDDAASDKIYMIGEFVDGGALMRDEKAVRALPLEKARRYFCMLIDGIFYLHFNNVVHRDIKPGNLLLDLATDVVKITDFGVSQAFEPEKSDSLRSTAGTAAFLAPEMLTGAEFSGRQQDVWACGVTLYMFVYGTTPFYAETVQATYELIRRCVIPWRTHTALGEPLDLAELADCNDLIAHMLDPDPATRYTLEMARAHRFLAASGINMRALPREAVSVSDEEVAAAFSNVIKFRAIIKAAVIGRRSLNAARMRIAQRRAAAEAAAEAGHPNAALSKSESSIASHSNSFALRATESFTGLGDGHDDGHDMGDSSDSNSTGGLHRSSTGRSFASDTTNHSAYRLSTSFAGDVDGGGGDATPPRSLYVELSAVASPQAPSEAAVAQ